MVITVFRGIHVKMFIDTFLQRNGVSELYNTVNGSVVSIMGLSMIQYQGAIYLIPNESVSKFITEDNTLVSGDINKSIGKLKRHTKISKTYLLDKWIDDQVELEKNALTSAININLDTEFGRLVKSKLDENGSTQVKVSTKSDRAKFRAMNKKFNKDFKKMSLEELSKFLNIIGLKLSIDVTHS